jgi:hypothetical protein
MRLYADECDQLGCLYPLSTEKRGWGIGDREGCALENPASLEVDGFGRLWVVSRVEEDAAVQTVGFHLEAWRDGILDQHDLGALAAAMFELGRHGSECDLRMRCCFQYTALTRGRKLPTEATGGR